MSQEWRVDDKGNRIHSTAVVGQDVVLGHRNSVGPLSVVGGLGCSVILGDDNSIGVGSVIGSPPESATGYSWSTHLNFEEWARQNSEVVKGVIIGSKCVIRDKVTIHAGMLKSTSIADLNYIHSSCHVDHDVSSQVGTVLAPLVAIGGEVSLGAFCQIGMGACLHQGSSIGALTMIGMNSTVKGHVRPMSLLYGSPARYHGINLIRLNRLGLDDATLLRASKYSAGELSNESEVTECNALIATLVSQSLAEALHAWTA